MIPQKVNLFSNDFMNITMKMTVKIPTFALCIWSVFALTLYVYFCAQTQAHSLDVKMYLAMTMFLILINDLIYR